MAESHVVVRNCVEFTQDRFAIRRNGFRPDAIGIQSKRRISVDHGARFAQKSLNRFLADE